MKPSRSTAPRTILTALAVGLAPLLAATAVERTWTGSFSTAWHQANNWNPPGIPAAGDTVLIPSGTVVISSPVTIAGELRWTGGTLQQGQITVTAGGLLTMDGAGGKTLDRVTLVNEGTVEWGGSGGLTGYYGGNGQQVLITNAAGGQFNLRSDSSLTMNGGYSYNGTLVLHNAGTLTTLAGTGTNSIGSGIDLINFGAVDVRQGTLQTSGRYICGPGSRLLTGIGGPLAGQDYGRLLVSGTATLDGAYAGYLTQAVPPGTVPAVIPFRAQSFQGGFDLGGAMPLGQDYYGLPSFAGGQLTLELRHVPAITLQSLGVENGQFQLQVQGSSNSEFTLEASTNLVNWDWLVTTNTPTGEFLWTDDISLWPHRFYRTRITVSANP
jgi:hypothetical protein